MKAKVNYEVEVPATWFEHMASRDPFAHSHSGYWSFGVQIPGGWLLHETTDGRPLDSECEAARRAWKANKKLPAKWHLLDARVAARVFVAGCRRWGEDWHKGDHADAAGYDLLLQLVLLGEIRYG